MTISGLWSVVKALTTSPFLEIYSVGFFVISEDSKYARCNKFLELVAHGGNSAKSYNTSNLVYHLRSHHSREYAN